MPNYRWALAIFPILGVAKQANVPDKLNRWLMGVFRDLARVKSYRRRQKGNSMALMTVLLKQEDPLLGIDFEAEDANSNVPTFTLAELYEMGRNDDQLLLSVFGRVYDVTQGSRFYGSQARYHMFPGYDVTYALSTGCKQDSCLTKTADELTDAEIQEGQRWLSFFQLHDKYPFVGKLDSHPMEDQMDEWVEEAVAKSTGDPPKMPKVF